MLKRLFLALLLSVSGPVTAQTWSDRAGDTALAGDALESAIVGQRIVFFDDGRSRYSAGGAYSYTYFQGGTAFGTYEIAEDGQVCIAFRNGFSRCDRFVENNGRLVMLTGDGQRFPVR